MINDVTAENLGLMGTIGRTVSIIYFMTTEYDLITSTSRSHASFSANLIRDMILGEFPVEFSCPTPANG
jgi:hypothetical protein